MYPFCLLGCCQDVKSKRGVQKALKKAKSYLQVNTIFKQIKALETITKEKVEKEEEEEDDDYFGQVQENSSNAKIILSLKDKKNFMENSQSSSSSIVPYNSQRGINQNSMQNVEKPPCKMYHNGKNVDQNMF